MKKRALPVLLALSLTLALAVPALAARVVLSPQKVYVDGAEAAFEGYNIDGYNYFRLQDLAIALKDGPARFSVAYDAAADLVALVRGGDCALTDEGAPAAGDRSASAAPSVQTVTIDGAPARLSPYNIGGYNFFRLGELAPLLGFGLAYDKTENSGKITGAPAAAVTVSFIDVGRETAFLSTTAILRCSLTPVRRIRATPCPIPSGPTWTATWTWSLPPTPTPTTSAG